MASPETKIYVSPSVSGVAPGESFSADINIANVTGLWYYQLFLVWNPTILDVVNTTEGTFLSRSPRAYKTWFQPRINNTEGWAALICTIYGEAPTAAASGSGTLVTVNFRAKIEGESVLNLVENLNIGGEPFDAFIKDYAGDPIPFSLVDGHFVYPLRKIFVDPPNIVDPNLVPETLLIINISIVNIRDLYGWSLYLKWNPVLLNVTDAAEGPFLKAGGTTVFRSPEINQEAGYLYVNCTLTDQGGVSGNGTLVTITFMIETLGSTTLDIYNTTLIDSNLATMPHVAERGYFNNLIHNVAITSVEASSAEVKAGESVSVTVVAKNKGAVPETFDVKAWANYTLIGMETLSNLAPGANETLTFNWDTKDVAEGLYTIKAEATIVPEEIDTTDNEYVDGTIKVTQLGQTWPITLIAVALAVVVFIGIVVFFYTRRRRSSA